MKQKDFNKLSSSNPRVKYGFARKLLTIAKNNPTAIYSRLDFFAKLLKNENQIIKWTAADVIGYLAVADQKERIERHVPTLIGFLKAGKLITASHAIFALSKIASAKPALQKAITNALLKTERYRYETTECHNIVLGKVIDAFSSYGNQVKDDKVMAFMKRQTKNTRNAAKKKAKLFFRKFKS